MKKTWLWMLLVGGMLSCNKKEMVDRFSMSTLRGGTVGDVIIGTSVNDAKVRVSHGWLQFGSMQDFTTVMHALHSETDIGILADWEQKFPGYISLRATYERIDSDDSYERTAPTVDSLIVSGLLLDCPDSRFATVLNASGCIQIADTLYQFLPGQEKGEAYAIPERYINDLQSGIDVRTMDGVVVHTTSFVRNPFPRWQDGNAVTVRPGTGTSLGICNFPNTVLFNWWGQRGGDIYGSDQGFTFPQDNGRNVRLNYHRWRVSYIFYSSVGVRVKMWKHTRFAGWLSNIDFREATIDACAKGFVFNHLLLPVPFQNSIGPGFSAFHTNSLERTLKWHADPLFTDIFLEHFNFRFRVDYKGYLVERMIRE